MSILKSRQNIQRLLFMLRHHQLINAAQAAKQLNCAERTIKNYLRMLRQEGYVIKYDKGLQRYVIEEWNA